MSSKKRIEKVYPLSPMQSGILFHALKNEKSRAYFEQNVLKIKGEIDRDLFQQSFNLLFERHDILRTIFRVDKVEEPLQFVLKKRNFKLCYEDISDLNEHKKKVFIEEFTRADREKGFDLARDILMRAALYKTGSNAYTLVWSLHHILMDGWCLGVIYKELLQVYRWLKEGKPGTPGLEPVPPYITYINWLEKQDQERGLRYWRQYLEGYDHQARLPQLETVEPVKEEQYKPGKYTMQLGEKETAALNEIAGKSQTTVNIVFQTLWGILLQKYNNSDDVVFGVVVSGRSAGIEGIERMVGLFINTVPLRITTRASENFWQLLKRVRQDAAASRPFEHVSLAAVQSKSSLKGDLIHHLMAFLDFPLDEELKNPGMKPGNDFWVEDIRGLEQTNYNFDITIIPRQGFQVKFNYNALVYGNAFIKNVGRHFKQVIKQVLDFSLKPVKEIEVLSPEEKHQVLFEFNRAETGYPKNKTLHALFEEQVERAPDYIALVGKNPKSEIRKPKAPGGERLEGTGGLAPLPDFVQLSYRELNEKANPLARLLRKKGVQPDTMVGIMVGPSIDMMVGLLAILKAGGAYLPIDPKTPTNRVLSMLKDSSALILLTESKFLSNHSFTALQNQAAARVEHRVTAPRKRITDMDALPMANRSTIDYNRYNQFISSSGIKHNITLEGTRGCPYQCIYCHKIFPNKHIRRSAGNLFSEVQYYYNLGVRRFPIVDDIFNLDIKSSSRFFELLIKNGFNKDIQLLFTGGIRGDILTEDYIDLMIAAGTVCASPALETASPRLQKLINKNLDLPKFLRNVEYFCKKYPHVITELFTMHGFPTETEEEARMTMDFIKNLKWIHFPYINILRIYSTTKMAKIAVKHGVSYDSIMRSEDLAWHLLPETLPFSKEFTLKYQAEFLNEYLLCKERLLQVLPYQMQVMTEDELVQKYDSYFPADIDSFARLLEFTGIKPEELGSAEFVPEDRFAVPDLNEKLRKTSPIEVPEPDALRVLFMDLNLYFSHEAHMLYDLVDEPLGLIRLMTQLQREFGGKINSKIVKSRLDFNNYRELKTLLEEFKPGIIGIRTLTFYRDFIHKTISMIRQWGMNIPIIVGGPHVTTKYPAVLQDPNIHLAVLGEGEITIVELMGKILENQGKLPKEEILEKIPGLAFIPGKQGKEKKHREFAREIISLDAADTANGILSKESTGNLENTNQPTDIAYAIFTSGTTGKPKGIIVQHLNVNAYLFAFYREFNITPADTVIQLGSFTFDIFVEEVFPFLLKGGKIVIPDQLARLDIDALTRLIARHNVNIIDCTPLLLNEFNRVIATDPGNNPLKNVHTFISGGDVLKGNYIDYLQKAGNVYNTYGPTETTVCASYFRCDNRMGGNIPIGKPITNYRVYILDKNLALLPIGVPGEICVSSAGVTRGYLNRPELTYEKFNRDLKNYWDCHEGNHRSYRSYKSYIIYKTGDLGRWQPGGNIEFLGRLDNQVKIRGYRVELQEIQRQLVKHPGIREAVTLAKEDKTGDKYLCAYIIAARPRRGTHIEAQSTGQEGISPPVDSAELRAYLSKKLPDYMIPAFFIYLEKIPLTPGGKLNRKALPHPKIKIKKDYAGPWNEVEKKLVEIWQEVLDVGRDVGIDDNFFELGGHSLKATIMAAKIHKKFNVKLPLVNVFKTPTIKGLSESISKLRKVNYAPLEPAEKKEYYPLSSTQRRLYILHQMQGGGMSYNMPTVLELVGAVDGEKLEKAFKSLIKRQESFRSSFMMIRGQPVQRIHHKLDFKIQYYDMKKVEVKVKVEEKEEPFGQISEAFGEITRTGTAAHHSSFITHHSFVRPFDLSKAPLLRVELIKTAERGYIMLIDTHHIISDGVSTGILAAEFMALVEGKNLLPLRLQYHDYCVWQNSKQQKEAGKEQETYWLREFAGEIPILELPTDFPRPRLRSFAGDQLNFETGPRETAALKELAKKEQTTLFMVLLSLYTIFLAKITGQEDIPVGTPTAGRRHADLQNITGMFVNMLVLRNHPGDETGRGTYQTNGYNYTDFLKQVMQRTLAAFENQDYPFEDLVEKVDVPRDTGRNPLFDVVFTWLNMEIPEIVVPGLKLKPRPYENQTSKFDLTLVAVEQGQQLCFSFEYCTKLFKQETINRFINYFKNVIFSVIENPGNRLSKIEIISGLEKNQLLNDFNDTAALFPKDKTLHRLFEEQVEKTPDNIALVGPLQVKHRTYMTYRTYISYHELNEKAHQLAYVLKEKDVKPDTIVGIMVERSIEMIIGLLGILKAGGAYMPIDPDYPGKRINFMLKDSNASILLTGKDIDPSPSTLTLTSTCQVSPTNLAYIIYTSGTTGRPKGVMINHGNVVRLMVNNKSRFDFNDCDVWTLFHSFCFDFSVWEMYGALLYGGKLIIIPKITARDTARYLEILKEQAVTILNQTPSAFYHLTDLELKQPTTNLNLRWVIFGGEALSPARLKEWKKKYPETKLINMYGITETTVHVTFKEITLDEIQSNMSNIGTPIPTISTYIMDRYLNLLPGGIPGEICVGGEGVGRGYLNRPGLTREKFVENPGKPGERLYKSGDLAKLTPGTPGPELVYSGRIDAQVQIRGFRIEPGEIEARLSNHGQIVESVVTAKENENGEKFLCAYIAAQKKISTSELRDYLLRYLPGYMIPSYFVQLAKVPLTVNGKVDRRSLPEPEIVPGGAYTAPRSREEKVLVEIWTKVLNLAKNEINIDANFFELGGHSLRAAAVTGEIHKTLEVKVPLEEIFKTPTIRELAQTIRSAKQEKYIVVEPAEEKEYYPLSPAQRQFYILQHMELENTSYNTWNVTLLEGEPHRQRLEKTFRALIKRHELLRTSFQVINGTPVQLIKKNVPFKIEYYDAAQVEVEVKVEEEEEPFGQVLNACGEGTETHHSSFGIHHSFIRSFDLSEPPLFRVGLIKAEEKKYILIVDMHHIITDGTSMNLLINEFMHMYAAEGNGELPPLRLRYRDFSQWQDKDKQKNALKQQEEWWLKEFPRPGEVPVLNLPLDCKPGSRRSSISSPASRQRFTIDREETAALKTLALEEEATLFMVLLALGNVLLAKVCRQETIVLGVPAVSRKHADLTNIIGLFLNTLALKNFPSNKKTFREFLEEVREHTLNAFRNQDYPYEELAARLFPHKDTRSNSLFDVLFAMQNNEIIPGNGYGPEIKIPGLKLTPYEIENRLLPFEMVFLSFEHQGKINVSILYKIHLFKPGTIQQVINNFKEVLSAVLRDKNIRLKDITISHDLLAASPGSLLEDEGNFGF